MTRVTLICRTCGHTARRLLRIEAACRGTHETRSEPAFCPNGHGEMERKEPPMSRRKKRRLLESRV